MNYYKKIKKLKEKEISLLKEHFELLKKVPRVSKYFKDIKVREEYNNEKKKRGWFKNFIDPMPPVFETIGFMEYPFMESIEKDFPDIKENNDRLHRVCEKIKEIEYNSLRK